MPSIIPRKFENQSEIVQSNLEEEIKNENRWKDEEYTSKKCHLAPSDRTNFVKNVGVKNDKNLSYALNQIYHRKEEKTVHNIPNSCSFYMEDIKKKGFFHYFDARLSLEANLYGKSIIEYPIICVLVSDEGRKNEQSLFPRLINEINEG